MKVLDFTKEQIEEFSEDQAQSLQCDYEDANEHTKCMAFKAARAGRYDLVSVLDALYTEQQKAGELTEWMNAVRFEIMNEMKK
jgi:hypothetical protein